MVTLATRLARYIDGGSLVFIDSDASDLFTTKLWTFNIETCYSRHLPVESEASMSSYSWMDVWLRPVRYKTETSPLDKA
jgi:hypothetical protein